MHDCQKFREEWTDRAIGPLRLDRFPDFQMEIDSCSECDRFFKEVIAIDQALEAVNDAAFPAGLNWRECEKRLRARLMSEPAPAGQSGVRAMRPVFRWAALAAAMVLAVGLARYFTARPANIDHAASVVAPADIDLDPATVAFLGKSEMYLRAFTKIEPADMAELDDARDRARAQLADIQERKEAVALATPLQAALDEYESVLRDIKNLDGSSREDVLDIQSRIARRGLILDLKTFQPRATLATNR